MREKYQGSSDRQSRSHCPVEQLGWYVNHTLSQAEHVAVEQHLIHCTTCQQDLAGWHTLNTLVHSTTQQTPVPRADLFEMIEQQLDTPRQSRMRADLSVLFEHCIMQVKLIRHDLWWMPLLIIPLACYSAFYKYGSTQHASFVAFIGILLTAVGLAFVYGQEHDPAYEMVRVSPTSNSLLFALRLLVVFTYDLFINLVSMLPFLFMHSAITPLWFITTWLAPLCFLSMISLLISITLNAMTAVCACALLWGLRAITALPSYQDIAVLHQYSQFWQQTPLLFSGALILLFFTFFASERKGLKYQ